MKIIKLCFFAIFFIFLRVESDLIVYEKAEISAHKKNCIKKIRNNLSNKKDPTYQMKRAILTISGSDCDYIPKVKGAGEIFNEGCISYQLMHNGIKILLNSYYDSNWITDVIFGLKGHHEPQEEHCFYEILKYIPKNGIMLELGSYWAYYSLWFANDVENATTYLIEPDPKRLEIGKKNFALNNKTAQFFRGFVGVARDNEPDLNGAEYISIDDFIKQNQIQHINILHADIQGAEYEMLLSAVNTLEKIDYFFISTHRYEEDHLKCLDFFKKHDFLILAEHSCFESCSGDGLIVAKRKDVEGPNSIEIKKY